LVISTMRTHIDRSTTKLAFQFSLLALMLILCVAPYLLPAQAPAADLPGAGPFHRNIVS